MSYRETDEATRLAIELQDARREIERLTEKRRGEIVYRENGRAAPWVDGTLVVCSTTCIALAMAAVGAAANGYDRTALVLAAVDGLTALGAMYIWWRTLPRRGEP